jgi:hypothetical protein
MVNIINAIKNNSKKLKEYIKNNKYIVFKQRIIVRIGVDDVDTGSV